MTPIQPFFRPAGERAVAAIFLSGSGTNAERILEKYAAEQPPGFHVACLVTDNPEGSRARELGDRFRLPVVVNDIRAFYSRRGVRRVTLATPEGRRVREQWTAELRRQLVGFDLSFGVFAGFVPLTNLTADFPCLNVHPGDLTVRRDGRRHLVGLYTVPIERAILLGLNHLRTSVILAEPYTGQGEDMDSGLILGLSGQVPIDFGGQTVAALQEIAARRPATRPAGGYGDVLASLADAHLDRLKRGGDWVVFPPVVFDFAAGRFGRDEQGGLCYRQGDDWQPVETVVYDGGVPSPRPRMEAR